MNPQVDQDLCISCGLCIEIAPDVFAFDDDMVSHVIAAPTPENESDVQEAADSCPTGAITV